MNDPLFYKNLESIKTFKSITDLNHYKQVPDDWYILITDITNSTIAVQEGKYKEINIIGVAPIIGILNKIDPDSIPYVFGGDGVTLCVPDKHLSVVRDVIRNTINVASREYNLILRAGIVRVRDITLAGEDLLISKLKVSEAYNQALFFGGGLTLAEKWLKSDSDKIERIFSKQIDEVSYQGLECRWEPIKSNLDHTVSILIKSISNDKMAQLNLYRDYIEIYEQIFGNPEPHPIKRELMTMNTGLKGLTAEAKIRTFGLNRLSRVVYTINTKIRLLIGRFMMSNDITTNSTAWGNYQSDLIANSDFRKFDEMIRQVISCTKAQLAQLDTWLEEKYQNKELVYGLHVTDSALITCMVFQYDKSHVHFIDGNNGGYTSAAIELKKRAKKLEQDNP